MADGLVVIRPSRGCIVAGLTLDEIYETFEIRSVLEGLAVRLALPRTDADVIAELERLLDRIGRAGDVRERRLGERGTTSSMPPSAG